MFGVCSMLDPATEKDWAQPGQARGRGFESAPKFYLHHGHFLRGASAARLFDYVAWSTGGSELRSGLGRPQPWRGGPDLPPPGGGQTLVCAAAIPPQL